MAITPLSNIQFVSQNAALPSTHASNELAKESFASMANLAEFQAKEKAVEKLDKVAQSDEVQDEIKEKADEEQEKRKKRHAKEDEANEEKSNSSEEESEQTQIHRLDLSI